LVVVAPAGDDGEEVLVVVGASAQVTFPADELKTYRPRAIKEMYAPLFFRLPPQAAFKASRERLAAPETVAPWFVPVVASVPVVESVPSDDVSGAPAVTPWGAWLDAALACARPTLEVFAVSEIVLAAKTAVAESTSTTSAISGLRKRSTMFILPCQLGWTTQIRAG
jgi:hypothetical protein